MYCCTSTDNNEVACGSGTIAETPGFFPAQGKFMYGQMLSSTQSQYKITPEKEIKQNRVFRESFSRNTAADQQYALLTHAHP
jgi:hypothetical protein